MGKNNDLGLKDCTLCASRGEAIAHRMCLRCYELVQSARGHNVRVLPNGARQRFIELFHTHVWGTEFRNDAECPCCVCEQEASLVTHFCARCAQTTEACRQRRLWEMRAARDAEQAEASKKKAHAVLSALVSAAGDKRDEWVTFRYHNNGDELIHDAPWHRAAMRVSCIASIEKLADGVVVLRRTNVTGFYVVHPEDAAQVAFRAGLPFWPLDAIARFESTEQESAT